MVGCPFLVGQWLVTRAIGNRWVFIVPASHRLAPDHGKVLYLVARAMKFAKGILSDKEQTGQPDRVEDKPATSSVREKAPREGREPAAAEPAMPKEGHLFETVDEKTGNARKYAKLLGAVVGGVIVVGVATAYLTLPGVGDKVRVPTALELAVRDHFLTKEKRTATDITFYQCDGYYAARVGVETRDDIPNPLLRLDTYTARAAPAGNGWEITAAPVTPSVPFAPCK